jgi:hypothetical protein
MRGSKASRQRSGLLRDTQTTLECLRETFNMGKKFLEDRIVELSQE